MACMSVCIQRLFQASWFWGSSSFRIERELFFFLPEVEIVVIRHVDPLITIFSDNDISTLKQQVWDSVGI